MLTRWDEGLVLHGDPEVMPVIVLLATFLLLLQKNNVKLKMGREEKPREALGTLEKAA